MRYLAALIVLLLAILIATFYLRSQLPDSIVEQPVTSADNLPLYKEPVSSPLSATQEVSLQPDSTAIYCATLQLAWNELGDKHLGFPIQLSGESPVVDSLNRKLISSKDVGTNGVLVKSGPCSRKELAELKKQLDDQFPGSPFPLPNLDLLKGAPGLFVFACLARNLEFDNPFDRLRAIDFSNSKGEKLAMVEAFGIEKYGSRGNDLRKQVRILHDSGDHSGDQSFILELRTKAQDEELILASVPAKATLKETIDSALQMIKTSRPKPLGDEDELRIPVIQVNAIYSFSEIVGRKIENPGFENLEILECSQLVRFQLNELGARVESSAVTISELNGHRVFIYNNPFLLMIRKKGSSRPYYAMWVGDENFLIIRKL